MMGQVRSGLLYEKNKTICKLSFKSILLNIILYRLSKRFSIVFDFFFFFFLSERNGRSFTVLKHKNTLITVLGIS